MAGPRRGSRAAPAYFPGAPFQGRLVVLVLASGVATLAAEIALSRAFLDVLGASVAANAAVVAGTLGGLSAGALAAAVLARKPRAFARLAAALLAAGGLAFLVVPPLLRWSSRLVDAGLGRVGVSPEGHATEAVRAALALLLAAVPAALLGTTLPLAYEHARQRGGAASRSFASLYAWSTAGGAGGALLAGLVLLRDVGVTGTLAAAFACTVAAALPLFLAPASAGGGALPPEGGTGVGSDSRVPPGLAALVFLAGLVSIGLEVAWTRSLVLFLGSSLRTFSLVLATLLVAMAAGAAASVRVRPVASLVPFGVGVLLLAAAAAGTLVPSTRPEGLARLVAGLGLGDAFTSPGARLLVAAAFVALPGLAMGALLPLAVAAAPPGAGKAGRLYAISAAGNVVGALLSGFVLVPAAGATRSVALLAWIALLVAGAAFWRAPSGGTGRRLAAGAFLAALLLAPALVGFRSPEARLARLGRVGAVVDAREGIRGLVSVTEVPPLPLLVDNVRAPSLLTPGGRYLVIAVDGVEVAGTAPDLRLTQRMQAHVPLLLHGRARAVLQVGYGSGETTRTAGLYGLSPEVVEINPEVVSLSRRWFAFPSPPGTRIVTGDAKGFLGRTTRSWDVILNDSTYPGISGSSQLYSADHFLACRSRLSPGGIVSTWLPIDLPPETFRTVLASFARAFPDAGFYLPTSCLSKHGVLVGRTAGATGKSEGVGVPEAALASLEEVGYAGADDVASARILDAGAIARLAGGVPPSTDDRPRLDYPPRHDRVSGDDFWIETLGLLIEAVPSPGPGRVAPATDCRVEANRLLLLGQRELLRSEPDRALRLFLEAEAACPEAAARARANVRGILVQRAQREFAAAMDGISRGASAEAIRHLTTSVRLFPDSAAGRYELGRLLLGAGRAGDAARELEACLAIGTTSRAAAILLGDAYLAQGRLVEAESAYRRAAEIGAVESDSRLRALAEGRPATEPSGPSTPEPAPETRAAEGPESRRPPRP